MPWGAVAFSKPIPHCGPTVDPSVHLWRCVGLHRSPRKPGSKARAAVFVGFASAPFSPNPGVPRRVPSLPYNVDTLKSFQCVFEGTLGFTATLGTPVQIKERRCRWRAPQLLSASSWSLADALGCRGVSQACHTLWTHCGPFDASLKGRWTSPWPLEVRFKGKSGGVCGVRLSSFQPSYWSLNDALGCRGVLQACHTL